MEHIGGVEPRDRHDGDLPTTGFARAVSGVTVHTFLTRIATATLDEDIFWELAPHIEALAEHEGFPAHAASVTARRA